MSDLRPSGRLEFLDGARAIAALYVVLHHTYLTVYPHNDPTGAAAWMFSWLQYGSFGVAVFIVVSGYSLTIRPAREGGLGESYWSFIRRRFRRIVLPYWIALVVSLIFALTLLGARTGTHWDVALPVTWQAAVGHILVFQDVVYSSAINHVFWSVALEWHIYFVFPMLLWVWRRVGRFWPTFGLLVVTVVVAGLAGRAGIFVPVLQYADFLGLFAVGALCCGVSSLGLYPRFGAQRWATAASGLVVMASVALLVVRSTTVAVAMVGLATAAALVAMAGGRLAPIRRFAQRRSIVWLGTISYSLYLVHAPVVQLVWQYALVPLGFHLRDPAGLTLLLPSAVVLSALAAWGFWFLGERPFLSAPHRRRAGLGRSPRKDVDPVEADPAATAPES